MQILPTEDIKRTLISAAIVGLYNKKEKNVDEYWKTVNDITHFVYMTTNTRLPAAGINELFDKYITPEEIAARIMLRLETA